MRRLFFVLLPVLALSGCGTLFHNSYQKILVDTPGVIGAECDITGGGHHYRVITPNKVMIQRTDETLRFLCKKAQYFPTIKDVKSKINPGHSMWNVFNGIIPGTAYDIASGAIYEYPNVIEVEMEFDAEGAAAAEEDYEVPALPPGKKERPEAGMPVVEKADPAPADKSMSKALRK